MRTYKRSLPKDTKMQLFNNRTKKAKTKKEAADWAEFPYKALGDKLRIVADPKADFGDKDVTIKPTIKDLTGDDE